MFAEAKSFTFGLSLGAPFSTIDLPVSRKIVVRDFCKADLQAVAVLHTSTHARRHARAHNVTSRWWLLALSPRVTPNNQVLLSSFYRAGVYRSSQNRRKADVRRYPLWDLELKINIDKHYCLIQFNSRWQFCSNGILIFVIQLSEMSRIYLKFGSLLRERELKFFIGNNTLRVQFHQFRDILYRRKSGRKPHTQG